MFLLLSNSSVLVAFLNQHSNDEISLSADDATTVTATNGESSFDHRNSINDIKSVVTGENFRNDAEEDAKQNISGDAPESNNEADIIASPAVDTEAVEKVESEDAQDKEEVNGEDDAADDNAHENDFITEEHGTEKVGISFKNHFKRAFQIGRLFFCLISYILSYFTCIKPEYYYCIFHISHIHRQTYIYHNNRSCENKNTSLQIIPIERVCEISMLAHSFFAMKNLS